jgi:2-C-methyl-D-erythritol 4-phosphate cytidylyltransferase/2-C-methyl-D-erythritol 2,4-cyclodiphosphate synthase
MNIDSYMAKTKNAELILACGGRSVRMGQNKLLMDICGKPCILRTCEVFDYSGYIKRIIIAAPPELHDVYRKTLEGIKTPIVFVSGGDTRQQSIMKAVKQAKEDIIVIHDGARPLITTSVIERSVEDAFSFGSSIVCVPSKDTIRLDDGESSYSPPRSNAYIVQTPQSFSRLLYLKACESVTGDYTDDAQLLDAVGIKPHITTGEYSNIKITTAEDIDMARSLIGGTPRIGHGYDVHRLVDGRALILGGVNIPYGKGLLGHSDADVLTHALMDALLGAAAMGDIGKLFPDNDDRYKGADSIELLKVVTKRLAENGFSIVNVDVTVIAQLPKLSPYIDDMRTRLSQAMDIPMNSVSVKATTEEHLGFTGSGEGIAAHAVAMICG